MTSSFGDTPEEATCPHCRQTVVTQTKYVSSLLTWLNCAILCTLGCLLLGIIPFLINSCKDVEHRCPNCNQLIGLYKRK